MTYPPPFYRDLLLRLSGLHNWSSFEDVTIQSADPPALRLQYSVITPQDRREHDMLVPQLYLHLMIKKNGRRIYHY